MSRITNDQNQVAVKYIQPVRAMAKGYPQYVFAVRANISMSWVEPKDVDGILRIKGGCCGGKKQQFALANESDVRRWTNGGGR